MSMGIENMTADEVRVLQRVLLGVCGAVMGELAEACRELAGADCGVEPETPEEVPEEPEEDGSDEGDEGDEGDGSDEGDEGDEEDEGDEGDEEDEPAEKRRWRLITDEEILGWVEKRDEGMPITEIARLAGRGISVVSRKLKEYDSAQLDAARNAEDAEDEEDEEGNEE